MLDMAESAIDLFSSILVCTTPNGDCMDRWWLLLYLAGDVGNILTALIDHKTGALAAWVILTELPNVRIPLVGIRWVTEGKISRNLSPLIAHCIERLSVKLLRLA
jgi:hypothetical protein